MLDFRVEDIERMKRSVINEICIEQRDEIAKLKKQNDEYWSLLCKIDDVVTEVQLKRAGK